MKVYCRSFNQHSYNGLSEMVLDLGLGAEIDCFLVAEKGWIRRKGGNSY
jgi:hypothetical protein